jgi:pyruvate-ferredoxin/flavodoxin oxidoreductase
MPILVQRLAYEHRVGLEVEKEGRFAILTGADPDQARVLHELAQKDIEERWRFYSQMAGLKRSVVESGKEI